MTQFSAPEMLITGDGLSTPADNLALDITVLEQVLSFGDMSVRGTLLAQLAEDFQRLASAIDVTDPLAVAAAAHELKGLSATIGANRLSGMANTLNGSAERLSEADRAMLLRTLLAELGTVLASIRSFGKAQTLP
jgi:hypothetical protein